MFGSHMLEVGVGLVLLFLFVSLLCTAAREALEGLMKTRALDLERGIRELLDDPTGTDVVKAFYDHPMIYGLFAGDYDPARLRPGKTLAGGEGLHMPSGARANLPSYIPTGNFATAVMDLVARGEAIVIPYGRALRTVLPAGAPLTVEGLRAAAEDLPNARLRRAVIAAIDHSSGDLARVKMNLEAWFDGGMDRVAGWSKRRTQLFLFLLGLSAAAAFNIDALTVAQRLERDEPLRRAWVAQADRTADAQGGVANLRARPLKQLEAELLGLRPPIGWSPAPQEVRCASGPACVYGTDPWALVGIALGWLVTALAVTLGAPFWFDLLNKFMVIRTTVKPREKSPEEGSEDSRPRKGASREAEAGPMATPAPAAVTAPPAATLYEPHEWADDDARQEGVL
ncbi:MAG TPA: hypothetical protein VF559_06000 [Caulobacteraceae bacterium]|jgi:hypothetical protein